MTPRWAALAFVLLLASGCTDTGADVHAAGIPEGRPAEGANAGSPSEHGRPARDDGSVTVTREGSLGTGRFVARRTIVIDNDFGGASQASVSLDTGAGGVTARAWSQGGYRLVAVLEARADSESKARDGLDSMSLVHSDRLSDGKLTLSSAVQFPNLGPTDISRSGTLTMSLPEEPSYRIALDAGSGSATTAGLSGPSVVADTGSGGISIDGHFARMVADAGSGGVELLGTANDVVADTGSGSISAKLRPGGDGRWLFDAGSGDVRLALRGTSSAAFDVVADAGSGDVDVGFSGGQPVGAQDDDHAHVRSAGYADADVQVQVVVDTGSGDITVAD